MANLTKEDAIPCDDGVHCDGECPFLAPYGDEYSITAKCNLTGEDLMWYDYWVATGCGEKVKEEE